MNDQLQIVIPTYRRMARLATLKNLPAEWMSRTTLVMDEEDEKLAGLYDLRNAGVLVKPKEVHTIAQKRAWIIREFASGGYSKIVMFDDDLRFAVRSGSDTTALRQATSEDLLYHLGELEKKLDDYSHAGWSARQGNNRIPGGWLHNVRMMYCLAYRVDDLVDHETNKRVELGRIETREDMDLTLQLLRLGYSNAVCADIATDQVSGYAAVGGCSEQRTIATSNADADKLAELHPGFVRVVEKEYKGSLNRKEVVVSWKKAFESAWGDGKRK